MAVGKIDERGRVLIPEPLREQAGLSPGQPVHIRTRGREVSIEPADGSGADPFLALIRSPVRGGWRDPEPLEEEQWGSSSRTRAR